MKKKISSRSFVRRPRRGQFGNNGGFTNLNERIVSASFRFVSNTNSSVTGSAVAVTELNVNPSTMGARCVAMADLFSTWRLRGLRIHAQCHPATRFFTAGSAGNTENMLGFTTYGVAYVAQPNTNYAAPTTIAQIVDFPAFMERNDTSPTIDFTVAPALLQDRPGRWLHTVQSGTVPDIDYTAGCITYFSSCFLTMDTAANVELVVEADVDFKGAIDPALLPQLRLKDRSQSSKDDFEIEEKELVPPKLERQNSVQVLYERPSSVGLPSRPSTKK